MGKTENGFLFNVLKGVGITLVSVIVGIAVFAFVVKSAGLNTTVIKAVNQFIKAVSILVGCIFSLKKEKGLLKGITVGALSLFMTYLIFSLLGGEVGFGKEFIIDMGFGIVVGAISGIISVNLKQESV